MPKSRYLIPAVLLLLVGGVAAWLLFPGGPRLPPWTPALGAASQANNRFAFDLYGKLRTQPGNLFVSPVCLHANLSAAADRSAGTTRDELLAALHLPKDGTAGDLSAYYSAPRTGVELALASAAWGEKTTPWKADFLARTPDFRTADFANNPDGERAAVNRWAAEQTAGMIPEALPNGAITRDTKYVGANAAYFRAPWKVQFDPTLTAPRDFTRADGTKVKTPTMWLGEMYRLKSSGVRTDPEVLELPYRGGELSFVVIMPKKYDGLPALEAQLSDETLTRWLGTLRDDKTDVGLPKFRHEWRATDLPATLKALGIRAAFDRSTADFGPMTADKLHLDAVHHATVIEVDEAGTRAAAVASDGTKSKPGHFIADHPFLYLIRDAKRGTILFLGRFAAP